ncbi:MAG: hypothetical protein LOD90_07880 [Symbiobacteriaceae bacterium]
MHPQLPGPPGGTGWARNLRSLLAAGLLWVLAALLAAGALRAIRGLPFPSGLPSWPGALSAARPVAVEVAFAWPEYPGRLRSTDPQLLARVHRALAAARGNAPRRAAGPPSAEAPDPHFPYWTLTVVDRAGERRTIFVSADGRFHEAGYGPLKRAGDLWQAIRPLLARLEQDVFGEALPWEQVDRLWPRGSAAAIRDLETGRRFRVSRLGGTQHADAEPLTPADTARLRSLYGGAWSWRRRAVVLEVGGRRVAASINGMPHGEEAVAANDFPGHFCVHTLRSTTHGGGRVDPAHHLMILKSSGRLARTLLTAAPHQVAGFLLVALANGDVATAAHMATDPGSAGWRQESARLARDLVFVELGPARTIVADPEGREARVELQVDAWYGGDGGGGHGRHHLVWRLVRRSGFWTVPAEQLGHLRPGEAQGVMAPPARLRECLGWSGREESGHG